MGDVAGSLSDIVEAGRCKTAVAQQIGSSCRHRSRSAVHVFLNVPCPLSADRLHQYSCTLWVPENRGISQVGKLRLMPARKQE